jgi:type I restriction enzyme S subunit
MCAEGVWDTVRLDEIAQFRNGVNYNKRNFGAGVKIINVRDFQDHSIASYESLDEINPKGVVQQESLLREGDLLFVRSNGNRELIGRSLFVADPPQGVTHSAFTIRVRFTSDKALPRFYAYLFRSSLIRQVLSAQGNGTNISNLNQGILSQLKVPLPPLPTQRKIAAILSAYDDLIENNTRRIKILEEMAQALYHEWFVHFRFPGHEGVRLVESELGLVPEGWEIKRLGDVATVKGGKRLPLGKLVQDKKTDHPYLRVVDFGERRLDRSAIKYIDDDVHRAINRYIITSDDVYISIAGTIGRIGLVPEDLSGANLTENAAKISLIHDRRDKYLLLYHLISSNGQNQIMAKTGGTSQPKLALFKIEEIQVVWPPEYLRIQFVKLVAECEKLIEVLDRRVVLLRRTRDLLLPKLISGDVDVVA